MVENFAPTLENSISQAEIATQQFMGVQNLYKGIVSMTSMEQRREIARNYGWENNNGKIHCKRRYTAAGVFHNMETLINPKNAYDLADEFLITEAGLVRDTLYFHNYWESFNRQTPTINTEDDVPTTVNVRSITQALEMSLKYEVLGRDNFRNELIGRGAVNKRPITVRDARGEIVQNAETRFLEIMEGLDNNLVLIAQNPKTRDLYFQAINDLTYRTNQKLKRLGIEKGLAAATTGLYLAPAAIGSCLPGIAAVVAVGANLIPPAAILVGGFRDAKIRDANPDSPLVKVIDRQPITPQPTKPVPLPSPIIKERHPIKVAKDKEPSPVVIKSEPLKSASVFNDNLGIPEDWAIPKGIQEPTTEDLKQLAMINLAAAELGNQQIEQPENLSYRNEFFVYGKPVLTRLADGKFEIGGKIYKKSGAIQALWHIVNNEELMVQGLRFIHATAINPPEFEPAPVLPEGATPIRIIGDQEINFGEVRIERRHNLWEFDITIGDTTYGGIEESEVESIVRELQHESGLPEACPDLTPYFKTLRNRREHKPDGQSPPSYFVGDTDSNRKPSGVKKTLGQIWKVMQKFLP